MNYIPLNYEQLNLIEGSYNPSQVYATNPAEVIFWERSLYQRAMDAIKFNIPEEWNADYFKYVLAMGGHIAVVDTPEYGVIPQWGTFYGYGIFLEPKYVNICNAYLQMNDLLIGQDCALIKFTPDYRGIYDVIHHYSEKLALISASIDMNAFNSRLAYIIAAKTKAGAETIKKTLDRISQGEPSVVIDEKVFKGVGGSQITDTPPWVEYSRDVKNSYVGTELWNEHRTILNEFDREVGIPTEGQEKKERMITDEIQVAQADSRCRLETWLESMKPGFRMVKELYGIDCSASARFNNIGSDDRGEADPDRTE